VAEFSTPVGVTSCNVRHLPIFLLTFFTRVILYVSPFFHLKRLLKIAIFFLSQNESFSSCSGEFDNFRCLIGTALFQSGRLPSVWLLPSLLMLSLQDTACLFVVPHHARFSRKVDASLFCPGGLSFHLLVFFSLGVSLIHLPPLCLCD